MDDDTCTWFDRWTFTCMNPDSDLYLCPCIAEDGTFCIRGYACIEQEQEDDE
jgi:hypothetical protein